ncbi:hypothetical protein D3C81_646540 [compost metagenome]
MAAATWLATSASAGTGLGRSARTTIAALVAFVLVRADVVGAVAEVVHFVIQELFRITVGWRRWYACLGGLGLTWLFIVTWLAFLTTTGRFLCGFFLVLVATFFLALIFAFVLASTVAGVGAIGTLTTAAARVVLRTFADFRFLGFNLGSIKTHQVAIWNLLAGNALDALEQLLFVWSNQRNGFTRATGTTGTADTVHVIFFDVRQLEVDHVRQLVNVQAASRNIGSNHDTHGAGLEIGQGLGTGILALVAMDGRSGQTVLFQVLGQAVGAMFGAGEDQNLFPGTGGNQVSEQGALVAGRQAIDPLLDTLNCGVGWRNLDALGVVQQLVGKVGDVLGEGRREQQVLTLGRQACEDFLHVVDEAHVEHAVGFVQHQGFDVGQINAALTGQVEQTARAGHQHVNALGHGLNLRVHADTTEDAGADELQVTGIDLEAFMHLRGEFASRGQDQYARLARAVTLGFVRVTVGEQPLQDRKGETAGFTSTCLCRDHQVATLQHGGNGPLLHRSGLGIASSLDGTD